MKATPQKIFWAENVRFLRKRKKMSQEALAAALEMGRAKLNAHENGHTLNPPLEDLLRVSTYFKISIDTLLKVHLEALGAFKLHELEKGNDVYLMGSNIRVLAISVDKSNQEHVAYVPIKAKAGYAAGYSDPEYIGSLPQYSFPDLPKNATYRIFPTQGDSMLPIPEGADVLARYVQDWKSLKPATLCIVVLRGGADLVFKQVTLQEDGYLLLSSLNKQYQPYTEPLSNVLELWAFVRYTSPSIPDQPSDLEELKGMIQDLKMEMRRLKD